LCSSFAGSAAGDKRLSIYSPGGGYSVQVVERQGLEYAPLLDILKPLGSLEARPDKHHLKLRFNNTDAEFSDKKNQAKVGGKKFDLTANFLIEDDHGLLPLPSLSTLLPRFLGEPVAFHEAARRLFIGNVATRFSAEMDTARPSTLVLNFSSPVNPTIATEPGRLVMLFTREPVVPPGAQTLTFPDKTIPSATFQEDNGAAEISVTATIPVMALFSNQGRTITIMPVTQAPANNAAQAPPPPPPAVSTPLPAPPALTPHTSAEHGFLVVIDAAHGGDDRGATLTEKLLEKDVALALARRVRQELQAMGVATYMLRDNDASLPLDQRASAANSMRPALYIAVHSTTQGTGARLYTSLLPEPDEGRGAFVAWNSAQASSLESSQAIAHDIALELTKKEIPVRTLAAPQRPLNNLTAPALALELAPPAADPAQVVSTPYQILVAQSVASAVVRLRDKGVPPR
jgi:N-acetylmuramoyl-L-alanine amidase